MGKRRLSLQQQRRVRDKRRAQGQTDLAAETDTSLAPPQEGVVSTRFGKEVDVLPPDFTAATVPRRCHLRANLTDIVTGDRVLWRDGEPTGVVESVYPREGVMTRPDRQGRPRPVAANIDRIGVVIAPQPRPYANLVDRYLVAAENQGIQPLLILNKLDLLDSESDLDDLLQAYRSLGYEVLRVSAKSGDGMGALLAFLAHHTTVLVGQSGVGKSTLVNILCPGAQAAIGDLSEQVAKGRHTTTAATLYALNGGGRLVDSPGIREFGLWHLDPRTLAEGFVEFRPLLGACRFRNCQHLEEPGCAVRAAAESGDIAPERFASYQHIVRELMQSEGR